MKISRNTVQRSLVLNALMKLNHPNADEIYSKVLETRPNISRGTVYRNLSILSDSGEILRISVSGGPDRYDINTYKHCHFLCNVCLKAYDIDADYPKDLMDNIKNKNGFYIDGYDIIYSGICQQCMYNNNDTEH